MVRRRLLGDHRWLGWVSFLVGAVVARHTVEHPILVGDDVPYHLLRARFGWRELFLHGHLDGWSPMFGAGSQHFLVYGPGLTFGFGLIKIVSLGQLSDTRSLGLLIWLTFAATGPAMYALARSLRIPAGHAGIAAVASFCVSVPFGVGVSGTFDIGLLAHGVATPLYLWGLSLVVRCCSDDQRGRPVLLALVSGLLLLVHPASALMFGLTVVVMLPFLVRDIGWVSATQRLGRSALYAAGMTAFWWVPLALRHAPTQPSPNWPTPTLSERIEAMIRGQFAFSPFVGAVVALCVLGLVANLVRSDATVWSQRLGAGLLLVPIALLVGTFLLNDAFPDVLAIALLANRGAGHIGLLLVLAAAMFVGDALSVAMRSQPARAVSTAAVGAPMLLLGVAVVLAGADAVPALERAISIERLPPEVEATIAGLVAHSTSNMRIEVANDTGLDKAYGRMNAPFWIAAGAHRNVLSDFGSNDVTPFDNYISLAFFAPPDGVTQQEWNEAVDQRILGAGVRRIVVGTEHEAAMEARAGWSRVWDDGVVFIFGWTPPVGHPDADALITTARPADIRLVTAENEHLSWDVAVTVPTDVTVAVARFDKWHATFAGQELVLDERDGLTLIHLRPGVGRLELTYQRDLGDLTGVLISTVTVALLGARAVRRRRRSAAHAAP